MIHKYKLYGYNIVLDVNSGAVHVVDDLFYDLIDGLGEDLPEKCPQELLSRFSDKYPADEILET